jgi:hypothetical protein
VKVTQYQMIREMCRKRNGRLSRRVKSEDERRKVTCSTIYLIKEIKNGKKDFGMGKRSESKS